MSPVTRVTLFKIPKEEDQQRLLDLYKQMPQKALKVSQPLHPVSTLSNNPKGRNTIYRLSPSWQGQARSTRTRLHSRRHLDFQLPGGLQLL
jgi:hypothetical protein